MSQDQGWPPVTQPLHTDERRAAEQRREVQALVRRELRSQPASVETKHVRGPREAR